MQGGRGTAIATSATSTPAGRVVVADDDDDVRRLLVRVLKRGGFETTSLADGVQLLDVIREQPPDVILLDRHMPHVDGLALLVEIKKSGIDVEVIIMTGDATVEAVIHALKAGAYDFLTKPFVDPDLTLAAVARAVEHRRLRARNDSLVAVLGGEGAFGGFIGDSAVMRKVYGMIHSVARWPTTVLITGESGTGKELVARTLHNQSPRKNKPFVAINCSAVPEALLESELFGHVRGAFTNAVAAHEGLFRAANEGTLFLDEIGDLPLPLQAKLLRVLQEGEVRPVGSSASIKVDVRLVAATHVDLAAARAAGRFRDDLYFRLDVVKVDLPPLRERRDDIVPLADHFLRKHTARIDKSVTSISADAARILISQEWKGNVRELENVIERAVIMCQGEALVPEDFSLNRDRERERDADERAAEIPAQLMEMPIVDARRVAVESFDRRYLEGQLRRANGNVAAAARASGMDRANFRRLLKRYRVRAEPFTEGEPE